MCLGCALGWWSTRAPLNLFDSFFSVHSQSKSPVIFPLAFVTGCYSSAILFLTFLLTLASRRGLPHCTAPTSVFLSLCWRIPSNCSRSDANIQVLLSMFNALVFLLLTATGTVLWLLCAQLKRNHFSRSVWAPVSAQGSRKSIFQCLISRISAAWGRGVPRLVCMGRCCTVQCPSGCDISSRG